MNDYNAYYVRAKENIYLRHPAGGAIATIVKNLLLDDFLVYAPFVSSESSRYVLINNIIDIESIYFDLNIMINDTEMFYQIEKKIREGNKVCIIGAPCIVNLNYS